MIFFDGNVEETIPRRYLRKAAGCCSFVSLKIVWKMKRVQQQNNVSNRCETHTTETEKAILERIMRHDRYKDHQIVNSNKDYRNSQ